MAFGVFCGRAGKITKDTLTAQINKWERACALRPTRKFVLATSLSARYFPLLTRTEVARHRITFGDRLPKRFHEEHEKAWERVRDLVFGELPQWGPSTQRYSTVRVSVQARSDVEAVESALDALDLLRGIWNLYFNVSSPARSSFGKRQPVNRLVLGPVYSLHEPSGKFATDRLWYPADYVGPLRPMLLKPFWKRLHEFEKLIRKYLPRSQYTEDIEVAIRRYTRTLDSRHWNTAFVELWSLLEHLTDTSTTGYDKTIRRALFLYHKDERD
jgi:hypothetical protein